MEKYEFVKDFSEFYKEIRRTRVNATAKEVTTLYAIYRKDLRANRLNNKNAKLNAGEQMTTEKQKNYLLDLAEEKGMRLTEQDVDKMTREQASKTIDALLGGD
jgi:adenine-specific DNA methylase